MDPLSLVYYAAVCSALGYYAPRMGGVPARLLIGALVGLAAAAILPMLRAAF